MRMFVFSIFDDKAKAFLPPFYMPTVGMAMRTFSDCVNDPRGEHAFARNAHDYTLFRLGTFDDSSGRFEMSDAMEALANGVQVRTSQDDDANKEVSRANGGIPGSLPVAARSVHE